MKKKQGGRKINEGKGEEHTDNKRRNYGNQKRRERKKGEETGIKESGKRERGKKEGEGGRMKE